MSKENKIKTNKIKKKATPGKEKENKSGFNILDALIIFCVACAVALLFFVYSPLDLLSIRSDNTTVIYSVRVSGVPTEYAGSINIGDQVSDGNGYNLGTVASAVEVESHAIYNFDEITNGIKPIVHPELVDLIITVSASAQKQEDGYSINGKRIAVEGEYELLLPGFEAKGICVSLSEENAREAGGVK